MSFLEEVRNCWHDRPAAAAGALTLTVALVSGALGYLLVPSDAHTPSEQPVAAAQMPGDDQVCKDIGDWVSRVTNSASTAGVGGANSDTFEIIAREGRDAAALSGQAKDPELASALSSTAKAIGVLAASNPSLLTNNDVAAAQFRLDLLGAGRPPVARCAVMSARSDIS